MTVVKEITTKGDWMQIEPPANAYAFVAAMYLKQETSGTLADQPCAINAKLRQRRLR